jgi:uncharacterized protein YndB with AHSA1/START domain
METIKHDLNVKADAPTAFKAVATEAGIKGWWAKNSTVGETLGSNVELHFTKPEMSATMTFDVTALEPGRLVEWTCKQNTNPIWLGSKLTWQIEPASEGSVVHFTHEGLSEGGPPYDMTVEGWQFFLGSLEAYLNGGAPYPSD